MSLVDDIFGSIPGPLIDQWGIDGTYVKQAASNVYNPATGTYASPAVAATEVPVRILIFNVEPSESSGEIQLTDVKILIAGNSLGDYYPRVDDWIEYVEAGVSRAAKVLKPLTHRGSSPILHSVIARAGAMPAPQAFSGIFEAGVFEAGVFA